MGALPTSEPVAFRFAPYIKELREFFAVSHLHFGSPEDIFPVNERLQTSKAFAEDMSSMIRSILLREGGSMAHAQLLEILAIAIGGPAMDHASQDYRQPLRQLLSFLTGVLRRPWNLPPGEEAEPDAPTSVAQYSAETASFDHASVVTFPSGPFATAAALAAAEQAQRQPETEAAAEAVPPEPVEIAAVEPERAPQLEQPDAVPEAAAPLEQTDVVPAPAEPEIPEPEPVMAQEAPEEPAPIEIRSSSELVDQILNPGLEAAELAPEEAALSPEPDAAKALPAPSPVPEPQPVLQAAAEPVAATAESAAHTLTPSEIVDAAARATPLPPAAVPVPPPAPTRQHFELSSEHWHDSPFRDSPFDDLDSPELVPDSTLHPRPGGAAPWIPTAVESRSRVPRISPSVRNVLIMGVAGIAIAVYVAVALRPTAPSDDDQTRAATARSTTSAPVSPTSPANPAASSLTPQPSQQPAGQPAKPTAYGDPFNPQPNSARRLRTSFDEDEDYNGSDVAPPTYRSFVAPSAASAASSTSSAQPAPSASESQPSSQTAPANGYSSEQQANERRGTSPTIGSGPGHQSFRNPDATLAGDPRPTRPGPRSLNGEPTFKVSSGMMAANLISAPNPEYPALAKLTHTQGEVIIQAVISRDGHVSATHVLSGHRLLRGAAVDAVKRWRYRPYISDGRPIDVATIIRVDFRNNHN